MNNDLKEKIICEIVRIFDFGADGWDYPNAQYELFSGKLGEMTPTNRVAFVEMYGEKITAEYERAARERIAAREKAFAETKYYKHAREADAFDGVPKEGTFFWAYNSGLKGDGGRGVYEELENILSYGDGGTPSLCKITRVFHVTQEEFERPNLADELVTKYRLEGGSTSEDIPEGATYDECSNELLRTIYTHGQAVVAPNGKWFLIDSEGYDYARYIYIPTTWNDMFAEEVQHIKDEQERRAEEERLQAEQARATRLAEYQAKCQKWEHLMTPVAPYEQAKNDAWDIYMHSSTRRKLHTTEHKALQAAERKLLSVRKKNILAMIKHAFPKLKVTVKKSNGYGSFDVIWSDGVTKKEMQEATDLDLFCSSHNTYDCWTGYKSIEYTEFHTFADKYMNLHEEICLYRKFNEESEKKIVAWLAANGINESNYTTEYWRVQNKMSPHYTIHTFHDLVWSVADRLSLYE